MTYRTPMELSQDQMDAVMAGRSGKSWVEVGECEEREVPEWCLDADVDWMEGYMNSPNIHLKVLPEVFDFAEKPVWEFDGKRTWMAKADGRAMVHHHGPANVEGPGGVWMTEQEDGYGGRHFPITTTGGEQVILRGPWHGCPLQGYAEVTTHDCKYPPFERRSPKEWMDTPGCFGLLVDAPLLHAILRKYLPNIQLAWVKKYGEIQLQPFPKGGKPKGF